MDKDTAARLPRIWPEFPMSAWNGRRIGWGDCGTGDFTVDDIMEVIASGESNADDWDGTCAAVLKLRDGRYIAYETYWGPTGDGFCEDAYGGDSDIFFATNQADAIMFGLTDEGRRMCGL